MPETLSFKCWNLIVKVFKKNHRLKIKWLKKTL